MSHLKMRNVPRQTIVPHWASNIAKTKTSEGNSAMLPVILVMKLSVKREELKKKLCTVFDSMSGDLVIISPSAVLFPLSYLAT